MNKFTRALALILSLCTLSVLPAAAAGADDEDAMRGVWVSSVYNLDYPSVQTTDAAALRRETGAVFLCRSGEITYRIPRNRILYFASDRRQVTCVTTQRGFTFYGKLDQVAREVGPDFVRIHQRYLVRAGAVERVSGSEVMLGGVTLPISRSCQKEAMLALTRAALEG